RRAVYAAAPISGLTRRVGAWHLRRRASTAAPPGPRPGRLPRQARFAYPPKAGPAWARTPARSSGAGSPARAVASAGAVGPVGIDVVDRRQRLVGRCARVADRVGAARQAVEDRHDADELLARPHDRNRHPHTRVP